MEYVILAIAIVVLAVVVGGALFLRPGRRAAPPAPPEKPVGARGGTVAEEVPAAAPAARPLVEAPPAPEIELPPPSAGRLVRLRARLARSQNAFGRTLLGLLSRDVLDDEAWDEIEDTLLAADMGVTPARQIMDDLRTKVQVLGSRDPAEIRDLLKAEMLAQIGPDLPRGLHTERHGNRPAVILVV